MKKNQPRANDQESSFSKLLGQRGGPRDEPPSCAGKMGIEDGYISCHVRVYTKFKLIYEFNRGGIYEKLFSRKSYHRAGRQFEHYLGILREVMAEQFVACLGKIFGWVLRRGRTRQTQLIFLLPDSASMSGGISNAEPQTNEPPDDYSI
jgi:hypothetical protein